MANATARGQFSPAEETLCDSLTQNIDAKQALIRLLDVNARDHQIVLTARNGEVAKLQASLSKVNVS